MFSEMPHGSKLHGMAHINFACVLVDISVLLKAISGS